MNDTQMATLKTELSKPAYAADLAVGKYSAIADALNERASVPNPVPPPKRDKLITWDAFLGALADADVLALYRTNGVMADHAKAALDSNNRLVAAAIWKALGPTLTAPSRTAVQALLSAAKEDDPNWPATIQQPSIAQAAGLGTVTADDVRAAARRMAGG